MDGLTHSPKLSEDDVIVMGHESRASDATETSDNDSADSEAGQPCWWCRGGITLPRFTNKTDKPCDICEKHDLLKFIHKDSRTYNPKDDEATIELGWIDHVVSRRNCPLCRIAVHCIRQKYLKQLPTTFWGDGMVEETKTKVFLKSHLPPDHEWKGQFTQGSLLVITEPPLENSPHNANHSARPPDTTVLKRPEAVLLSEGCLEAKHAYGGVKRRRLWPDVSLGLFGK